MNSELIYQTACNDCGGMGKKKQRIRKSVRIRYEKALEKWRSDGATGACPVKPERHLSTCFSCSGTGLLASEMCPVPDSEKYPNVAIIGGGIGRVALAVACMHRGIPFILYEKDNSFSDRSQGYGLTLRSEEHTSELQSRENLVCRLLLEKKK